MSTLTLVTLISIFIFVVSSSISLTLASSESKIRRDESMEARVSKIEDDTTKIKMDIKVTNVIRLILAPRACFIL